MRKYPLSTEIAHALFSRIDEYTVGDYAAIGINKQDFQKLSQTMHWRRDEIRNVMRTFNAILFGTLEVMGVPKLTVPAEYVGSVIAAIVNPANQLICCIWLAQERGTGAGALDMSARQEVSTGHDQVSAEQLFAIVCALQNTESSNEVKQRFRQKFGIRIEEQAKTAMV